MKKSGLLVCWLLPLLGAVPPPNPLAGTAWKETSTMERTVPVILYFQQDTLTIYQADGLRVLERALYHVEGKGLQLQKIDGASPCDKRSVATVSFTLTGDRLLVEPLADVCDSRLNAWSLLPYNKVPVPVK